MTSSEKISISRNIERITTKSIGNLKNVKITFKNIVDVVFDGKYKDKSTKEILEQFHKDSDFLLDKWIKSKETDFSIYSDQKYLSDLMICYYYVSKGSITGALKWFKKNKVDLSKLTCFEDYAGLGATTLHLLNSEFYNVIYFNDVNIQIDIAKKLVKAFHLRPFEHNDNRKSFPKADVVFTLETIEHFREPLKYIQELRWKLKPNGYLIYASGFRNVYPGHFTKYYHNNVEYTPGKISRMVKKYLREEFDLLYTGFNGKPFLWRLKPTLPL